MYIYYVPLSLIDIQTKMINLSMNLGDRWGRWNPAPVSIPDTNAPIQTRLGAAHEGEAEEQILRRAIFIFTFIFVLQI